jgi:hypothetical protein
MIHIPNYPLTVTRSSGSGHHTTTVYKGKVVSAHAPGIAKSVRMLHHAVASKALRGWNPHGR